MGKEEEEEEDEDEEVAAENVPILSLSFILFFFF